MKKQYKNSRWFNIFFLNYFQSSRHNREGKVKMTNCESWETERRRDLTCQLLPVARRSAWKVKTTSHLQPQPRCRCSRPRVSTQHNCILVPNNRSHTEEPATAWPRSAAHFQTTTGSANKDQVPKQQQQQRTAVVWDLEKHTNTTKNTRAPREIGTLLSCGRRCP